MKDFQILEKAFTVLLNDFVEEQVEELFKFYRDDEFDMKRYEGYQDTFLVGYAMALVFLSFTSAHPDSCITKKQVEKLLKGTMDYLSGNIPKMEVEPTLLEEAERLQTLLKEETQKLSAYAGRTFSPVCPDCNGSITPACKAHGPIVEPCKPIPTGDHYRCPVCFNRLDKNVCTKCEKVVESPALYSAPDFPGDKEIVISTEQIKKSSEKPEGENPAQP